MAQMIGMDVAEVRGLAQQLHQASDEINNLVSQLTSKLSSTTWVGNDRTKFEGDWQSQHVTALKNVSQSLVDAGTLAGQNADQQEQAST